MHNASSHTAVVTRKFMVVVAKSIMLVDYPSYSPNLASVAPTWPPRPRQPSLASPFAATASKHALVGGSATTSARTTMWLPL